MDYTKLPEGIYAEMQTEKGMIVLFLEHEKAPLTVASFVGLAEGKTYNKAKPSGTPYFDGLPFHRVVVDFMIQSGDPDGNGRGGPGYRFRDEFCATLEHNRAGIISMANAGPNSNGSQFFITLAACPLLNGRHTVFGHVVKGHKVVRAIEQGVKVETVRIVRNGASVQTYGPQDISKEIFTLFLED